MRARRDRGDIVLGWLVKLAVVLGLLGLVAFDGVSVAQARFQAADRATTAASAAADDYKANHDVQKAYNAAFATLTDGDTLETQTFAVSPDGLVTVRLHHRAKTLVVGRIGPLKHFTEAVETGEGRPAA
jgi:hypothetical protein